MELAEKLTALRKEKGLSQKELAEMMLVSRQAVSKWERGEAVPTTENLRYLSALYGVTMERLFGGEPEAALRLAVDEKRRQTRLAMAKWLALALWALVLLAAILCATFFRKEDKAIVPLNKIEGREIEPRKDIEIELEW